MKKIKLLIFILIVALALTPLSACGKEGEENPGGGGGDVEQPVDKTTINEFLDAMMESPYVNDSVTSEKFALKTPQNVGVKINNDALYPVESDEKFQSGNIFTPNLNSDPEANYNELCDIFRSAKNANVNGPVKIKLPEGVVQLKEVQGGLSNDITLFNLNGFDGLSIEGKNTQFEIIVENADWKGLFVLNNCKNVHFQGFSIDYTNSPSIVGTVVSSDADANTITVKWDKVFDNTLRANLGKGDTAIHSYIEINPFTKAPQLNGNIKWRWDPSDSPIDDMSKHVVDWKKRELTIQFTKGKIKPVENGTLAAIGIAYYEHDAFNLLRCENVYFEEITIHSCAGMAFRLNKSKNLYFNHSNIKLKENSPLLMTSTADGYHFDSCSGEILVTNSVIEYTHDDAFNIKAGYYMDVASCDIIKNTVVLNRTSFAVDNDVPKEGDVIEFYDADSLTPTGSAVVKSATEQGSNIKLECDGDLFGVARGQVAANVSVNPDFTFENNIVRNEKNRGMLLQVRGATIKNNTFENIAYGSLRITSELVSVFGETMLAKDILIENNKFINNNYNLGLYADIEIAAAGRAGTTANPETIEGIEIKNNFFANSGSYSIYMAACGDCKIANNLFYDVGKYFVSENALGAITFVNTKNVEVSENYNHYTLGEETFAGLSYGGLTDWDTIKLISNTNLSLYIPQVDVSVTEVKKSTNNFVIDGNLNDWENAGTEIEIVGKSLSSGAAYDSESDEFGLQMLKLTWKDDGIYFAFDVKDDKLDFGLKNMWWGKDVVEVFFSSVLDIPNADIQLTKNDGPTFQAAFTPEWNYSFNKNRTSDEIAEKMNQWQVSVVKNSHGYQGEVFIPFEAMGSLKSLITDEREFAMSFVIADAAREDGRERLQISNTAHFVETNKYVSSRMPRVIFVK